MNSLLQFSGANGGGECWPEAASAQQDTRQFIPAVKGPAVFLLLPNLCVSPRPKLQGWAALPRAVPGRCPLTFLARAESCQGQRHHQRCQQTPHVFFGCPGVPKIRAFLEVTEALQSLLLGSGLYPVIAWRDRGSGLCSCVWAPKQSLSFGTGDVGSWQAFSHPSQDLWHFQILHEVLNGSGEEKQLD